MNQQPEFWPFRSLPMSNYSLEMNSQWQNGWLKITNPPQPIEYQPFVTDYQTISCAPPAVQPTLVLRIPSKASNSERIVYIFVIILLVLVVLLSLGYFIKRKFYDFRYHSVLTRSGSSHTRSAREDDEIQLQKILDKQTTSKLMPSYFEDDDYGDDVSFNANEKGTLNRLEMYRKNLVEGSSSPSQQDQMNRSTTASEDLRL